MLLEQERMQVVEYGRRMSSSGLSKGTSGNISVFHRGMELMAITASGVDYFEASAEDIVVMKLNGEIVEGSKKPSSEYDLHANIYRSKEDANSVVHTHSMYATTFACLREPIVATHYLIAAANTSIIKVVPYAMYGSTKLVEEVNKVETNGNALLLANHGLITWSNSLANAFNIAENVEWVAEVLWRTKCVGQPTVLSNHEIEETIQSFKGYGQDADASTSGY